MDASATLNTAQFLLTWVLLGFLLAWMVIFAVLALRAQAWPTTDHKELPTPAHSFPVTSASMKLHVIAAQPVALQTEMGNYDTSEVETMPIRVV